MAIARRRLTLGQFLALPEEEPALEFWHGEVTQKVSPKTTHGAIQLEFGRRFNNAAVPARIARAFSEIRVTLAGISTVPDLVAFRWDRIPRLPDGSLDDEVTFPPDLAVEILSPGQSRPKLLDRCRWYAANGVVLTIFVDPWRRVVQLFRPDGESGELRGADIVDLGAVLPGYRLTMDELFAPLSADWS